MFVSLRMIGLPESRLADAKALATELRHAAPRIPGLTDCHVAAAYPGLSFNAGQVIWRSTFASEFEAAAAPFSDSWHKSIAPLLDGHRIDSIGYRLSHKGIGVGSGGIWRALVFRVWPHGFPDEALALERALLMMPRHVGAIRSWGLSTVATCEGSKAYTHVWEQEFEGPEGFTGEYMDHPIHWGLVDSWFDADCPQYIVDPILAQPVFSIDRPVIT